MINISIIDNDSAALRLLQRYVRESTAGREGVSVVGYRRPEMLLEEIEKRKCHILISDIDMPEMSGLEVGERGKSESVHHLCNGIYAVCDRELQDGRFSVRFKVRIRGTAAKDSLQTDGHDRKGQKKLLFYRSGKSKEESAF